MDSEKCVEKRMRHAVGAMVSDSGLKAYFNVSCHGNGRGGGGWVNVIVLVDDTWLFHRDYDIGVRSGSRSRSCLLSGLDKWLGILRARPL